MKPMLKYTLVALVASIVGFAFQSPGPVGSMIWPMADTMPEPEGGTAVALLGMAVIEAVAFGIGVVFLAFGLPWVRGMVERGAVFVWLAVSWLLVNWVPHTAAHMHMGNIETAGDLTTLAAIEYGYHATLVAAGIVLVVYFAGGFGRPSEAPTHAAAPSR